MESQRHGVAHLVQLVTDHGANLIVFEDFLLRGGGVGTTDRVGLAPVHVTNRLCGTLEGIGWDFDYDLQLASVALPVITNERLKAKGLYVKGEHARDAVRHGVMYLRRTHAEHGGEA